MALIIFFSWQKIAKDIDKINLGVMSRIIGEYAHERTLYVIIFL